MSRSIILNFILLALRDAYVDLAHSRKTSKEAELERGLEGGKK